MSLYLTHLKDNSSRKIRNFIETLSTVQSFSFDSRCELHKQEISGPNVITSYVQVFHSFSASSLGLTANRENYLL